MTNPAAEGAAAQLTEATNVILAAMAVVVGHKQSSMRVTEIRLWRIVTDGTEAARAPVTRPDICPGAMLLMDTDVRIGPASDEALLIQMQTKIYVSESGELLHTSTEVTEMEVMPEDVKGDSVAEKLLGDLKQAAMLLPPLEVTLLRIRLTAEDKSSPG